MSLHGRTSQDDYVTAPYIKTPPPSPPTEVSALPANIVFVPKKKPTATRSQSPGGVQGNPFLSILSSLTAHVYLSLPIFPSTPPSSWSPPLSCQNSARKATRQEGRFLHRPSCPCWRCSCSQPWQFCTWHVRAPANSPICDVDNVV